ncbi:MAG TPA: helix-turn-helix domain-containing protein [Candidatus Lokiarchaeia archaeon]|nr:helix-turn-helix domain-containing protein [Candidatus Lokiarchaeia archaeon]
MSIKPEVREALRKLGFSDYNITIYETLLAEKELDARVLSTKTKVPYSRVYEILNEMIEKGYITKLEGRPSTYVPKSPIDVLQGIQQQQEKELTENSAIVKEPLMNLYSETRSVQNAQISITYGKASNIVHMKNLIKNSVRSLSIVIFNFDILFSDILDELKLLKLKHVLPQVILPTEHENDDDVVALNDAGNFKFMLLPPTNMIIADEQNVLQVAAGDYLKNVSEDMVGVSTSHASTGFISKLMFKNLWESLQ